ncbi:Sorting nexin mvp1, partial [Ascosphaera aggregata]
MSTTPGPEKRQDMGLDKLKEVLSPEESPVVYSEVYKTVITADKASRHPGGRIYADEVKKILATAGLSSAQQDSIFHLAFSAQSDPSSGGLQEVEFHILLALIGLAQAGYEPTLDVVDEKRNSLPTPKIGYINELHPSDDTLPSRPNTSDHGGDDDQDDDSNNKDDGGNGDSSIDAITPASGQTRPNTSFQYTDIDPWGEESATVPRTAPHLTTSMTATPGSNFAAGFQSSFGDGDKRAGLGNMASSSVSGSTGFQPPLLSSRPTFGSGAWADAFPAQSFLDPASETFAGGFEQVSADRTQTGANNLSRTLGGGSKVPPPKDDEIISIVMLPEKEGMFMFQHRNYEVKSSRRESSVIRRYSDFVWLHDCLIKKYPFRQIPLLPPKRVA